MNFSYRVDTDGTLAGLRAARRDVQREVTKAVGGATSDLVLPRVRAATPRAGGGLVSSERAGATTRGGYVEARAPYAGLLNFGGIVRGAIRPRNKQALAFGGGVVAIVRTPRKYTGQHYLEKGVAAAMPAAEPRIRDAALRAFRAFPTSRS